HTVRNGMWRYRNFSCRPASALQPRRFVALRVGSYHGIQDIPGARRPRIWRGKHSAPGEAARDGTHSVPGRYHSAECDKILDRSPAATAERIEFLVTPCWPASARA